ncbi:MAG: DUF6171 family protein [Myxococcota bacterium]
MSASSPAAFPTCRHRGQSLSADTYMCVHPQVFMPDGVDLASCMRCAEVGKFCDREPVVVERQEFRTKDPSQRSRPWNLVKSLADFVADGCKTLSHEDYRARLLVCTHCDQRRDNTCNVCGCYLSLKARGRAFKCPLDKWPRIEVPPKPSKKAKKAAKDETPAP